MSADRVFERPIFARARRACLVLPDTRETSSWGHPNFRAGKRTFCAFELIGGRPSIAFRLAADHPELRLRRDIFSTPYGRSAWTSLWVDGTIDRGTIEILVEHSYRAVATRRMLQALKG
jgi:predicted DNA-binding protein (MmcQ/YjbR family)